MSDVLTWVADRRSDFNTVTDQGRRPTCLAFAVSGAHQTVASIAPVSVEYLHYASRKMQGGVGTLAAVDLALRTHGQPPEQQWPYDAAVDEDLLSPIPPLTTTGPYSRGSLTGIATDTSTLVDQLAVGQLPIIGLRATNNFMTLQRGVLLTAGSHGDGHAVVLVGAATYNGPDLRLIRNGDAVMCVRNSWGPVWGENGFGLIARSAWDDIVLAAAIFEAA